MSVDGAPGQQAFALLFAEPLSVFAAILTRTPVNPALSPLPQNFRFEAQVGRAMSDLDYPATGETDGSQLPPSSAIRTEYCGDAAALRPRLTSVAPLAVLDYWDKLRGARRFPARADFDPMAMRKHLPLIFMLDVLPDGQFRYRVVGSVISEFFGAGNPVGMTPEDVFGANAEVALAPMRICMERRQPYMHTASAAWHYCDRDYVYYEVVVLPLGDSDDKVDKLLCCAEFVSAEEAARA